MELRFQLRWLLSNRGITRITYMGTWNAFYVKTKDEAAVSAVRAEFPDAEIEEAPEFIGVRLPDDAFEAPEETLAELPRRLKTDVMWLGFQSAVDAFQFHHWRAGKQL